MDMITGIESSRIFKFRPASSGGFQFLPEQAKSSFYFYQTSAILIPTGQYIWQPANVPMSANSVENNIDEEIRLLSREDLLRDVLAMAGDWADREDISDDWLNNLWGDWADDIPDQSDDQETNNI